MKYVQSRLFLVQSALQAVLCAAFCFSDWGAENQAILAGAMLATVGIPHGANDYLWRPDRSKRGLLPFSVVYLGTMAAYLLLWWILPLPALLLFFAISVHHFGQSNFESDNALYAPSVLWGIWVLAFPGLIHLEEALEIFASMMGYPAFDIPVEKEILGYAKIGGLVTLSVAYLAVVYRMERAHWARYWGQWALLCIWYCITPLLFGFIVYFCVWHSLQSLRHQLLCFQALTGEKSLRFFKSLLLFGLVSLAGFGIFVYFRGLVVGEAFVLLSVIALPHVVVMHRLYGASAETSK